jgi:hypothetical protein
MFVGFAMPAPPSHSNPKFSRFDKFIVGINSGNRIRQYMAKYGMTLAGQPLWTEAESRLLRRFYPHYGRAYAALCRRTRNAVKSKAFRLGITRSRRVWSPEELKRLKSVYRAGISIQDIRNLLPGKTAKQIHSKAARSGWKRPRRQPKGTGIKPYDAVRMRAFTYRLTMRDLADLSATGSYFLTRKSQINWKKISKAVAMLNGNLSISWKDG